MNEAIQTYTLKTHYYVEYLHWNNKGFLDGFVDHQNNMYLLNDDYDKRKLTCETLFKKYKTEDFLWSNQSHTSIATPLFKQLSRFIPESTYNEHTRKMLDEFYPRALQWCKIYEELAEDLVNIDICKSYPNILLNNNCPVPVYSIHDVIEPYNCTSDLRQIGEFHIDETIINNFNVPIKIEAGFYSSNLVEFLVNELNMPEKI